MASKKSLKIPKTHECYFCNYVTIIKKDFNKHILTNKHNRLVNASKMLVINPEISSNYNTVYTCECGKTYSHSSSYYRHKKNCNITIVTDTNSETIDKDQLIMMLIKQNAELLKETSECKHMMIDVIKAGTNNTTIGTLSSFSNTGGSNNVALGYETSCKITTGNRRKKVYNMNYEKAKGLLENQEI